ncbi:MAG: C69 family dipeptidase [Bacteroidales bacterium]|nr:C69 family dipeptidase [Bacteroidales bacterium]
MKQYIRILSFITLLLTSLNSYAQSQGDGWNCFAVLAGKATTIDNSVLLAHNEDDSGEQMINIYNVPANKEKGTNKYIWVEFPGMAVADGFLNEYGVAVVSDACNSREDREDFTDGGVLYQVRESVAKYAKSARHAVEIIGKIVTEKGYTGSGRTYVVADCNQGWVCSVVKGRHWIAQRVPDDMVMSIPNYYTIGEIDLSDTSNFLGSPDIISYAQERGWYNPEKDGKFIFKKVYSNPGTYSSYRNAFRHISAMNYITGENYTLNPDTYPFALKPNRKLGLDDMIQILSSHGENIPDNLIKERKTDSHNECICNDRTVCAAIFQLRNYMPVEIGAVMWATAASPCIEAFIPWYSGMTQSPDGFTRFSSAELAQERHFSDSKEKQKNYPNGIAWKFVNRLEWVLEDYPARIGKISATKNKFQKKLFDNQQKFEEKIIKLHNSGSANSYKQIQAMLNEYTQRCYNNYFKDF